jgi:hypothetical protein
MNSMMSDQCISWNFAALQFNKLKLMLTFNFEN